MFNVNIRRICFSFLNLHSLNRMNMRLCSLIANLPRPSETVLRNSKQQRFASSFIHYLKLKQHIQTHHHCVNLQIDSSLFHLIEIIFSNYYSTFFCLFFNELFLSEMFYFSLNVYMIFSFNRYYRQVCFLVTLYDI